MILIIKGSGGDGQTTLFNTFVRKYVEETSASILSANKPDSGGYLADISSLAAWDNASSALTSPGQGGPEPSLEPITVQDNSVFAHNPAATDYIEKTAGKRVQVVEYTVQPGDKLSFIALDYGVSVESIMWANNLRDPDSIRPDQVLKIPPVSGIIHIVKKGDTVGTIAKKYGVETDTIVAYNGLPQDGQLQIDDEIIVPDGKIKGSGTAVARTSAFSHLPSLGDYFLIPTTGYNWGRVHGRNGVDIANSCGTSIFAAAEGTVAVSDAVGWNGGFGKFIKLIHPNGTETLYSHASKLLVSMGEYVSRGQLIALMGSTGRSTGCHLHFEVHGARNPLVK